MLSPSINAKVKLNSLCASTISRPVSYCGRSPVPISPNAANRTDVDLFGRTIFGANGSSSILEASGKTQTQTVRQAPASLISFRRMCEALPDYVVRVIDNEVRLNVSQNEFLTKNSVLDLFGQG